MEKNSTEQIEAGNKLIAEFMGGIYETHHAEERISGWYFTEQPTPYYKEGVAMINLRYDMDWNWIMPVVAKIALLGAKKPICYYNAERVRYLLQFGKVEYAFEAVISFIQWLNKQSK